MDKKCENEKWFESDNYEKFEEETDELTEIIELTRELIDYVDAWNKKGIKPTE